MYVKRVKWWQTVEGLLHLEIAVPFDVNKFIRSEINSSNRRKIVNLVEKAYKLVDEALRDVSFLNWFLGKEHEGYLDNIAVQFMLHEAAKLGELDLISEIHPNVKNSSYHVELKTDNVVITVNRSKDKHSTARKAIYRSILQKENQCYFVLDEVDFGNIKEEPGYLELTHNHLDRKLDFVVLGVPDGRGKWYSSINLLTEPHLVTKSPEENIIEEQQLVKFKQLAQGVHNNGGKES